MRKGSVTIAFDQSGTATAVEVQSQGGIPLSDDQIACLRNAYLMARAPCPVVPRSSARASFGVAVQPLGQPHHVDPK